jgi:cytoskeleton protein RodZ
MEPQYRTETPQDEHSEAAGAAPPMPARESVGALLRRKREGFRQDLYTVAGQLHIRLAYLKAIEDGRFKDLPGLTYASGFVRSYADYLGLDGEEMVRRFREEIAGMDRQVQLIFPSLATEGKIPSGAVLLLSGFLAVMAYGVWYYLADRQKSFLDLVPEVPSQLRALLGSQPATNTASTGAEAKPAAGAVASAGPAGSHDTPIAPPPAVAPPPPLATTVLVNPGDLAPLPGEINGLIAAAQAASLGTQPAASNAMSSTVAAGTVASSTTPSLPPAAPATTAPAATAAATASQASGASADTAAGGQKSAGQVVVASPGAHVKLTARMDSWVQIYDKAGKSYFSAVLRAGQTIEVPNQPGLLLTTGNIGGLDILIDGQALAALGSVGLVKRDLPLDVAQLKSASAASQ